MKDATKTKVDERRWADRPDGRGQGEPTEALSAAELAQLSGGFVPGRLDPCFKVKTKDTGP